MPSVLIERSTFYELAVYDAGARCVLSTFRAFLTSKIGKSSWTSRSCQMERAQSWSEQSQKQSNNGISEHIGGKWFDTKASNNGAIRGASVLIEQRLKKQPCASPAVITHWSFSCLRNFCRPWILCQVRQGPSSCDFNITGNLPNRQFEPDDAHPHERRLFDYVDRH